MKKTVIYLHGQGGNAGEAVHYRPLFRESDVIGFDYTAQTPWEAKEEFPQYFDLILKKSGSVWLIANSIGAFFAMNALSSKQIEKAFFISPIVDMEALILNMMTWAGVTENELREKAVIETNFGQTLSWEYLSYAREHPIKWDVPTGILYGGQDDLTSYETISAFAKRTNAELTVMKDGGHWFHTEEQMKFLDRWIVNNG